MVGLRTKSSNRCCARHSLHSSCRSWIELLNRYRASGRILARRSLLSRCRWNYRFVSSIVLVRVRRLIYYWRDRYGVSHGGACEETVRMLLKIGSPENVPAFIEQVKSKKVKLVRSFLIWCFVWFVECWYITSPLLSTISVRIRASSIHVSRSAISHHQEDGGEGLCDHRRVNTPSYRRSFEWCSQ